MNAVDRTFGWLLIIGSVLHGFGSINVYHRRPETMLWALSATLAGLLLAALNLLRIGRPGDRSLAWISFAGCLGWLAAIVGFGVVIGNGLDFRVAHHGADYGGAGDLQLSLGNGYPLGSIAA